MHRSYQAQLVLPARCVIEDIRHAGGPCAYAFLNARFSHTVFHKITPIIIFVNIVHPLGIHIIIKGGYRMEIRVWEARTQKGYTLVQLEGITGISKSTLNNIENGKTSPTLSQLESIASALGVQITDLFDSDLK